MKIKNLYEQSIPISSSISNAVIDFSSMNVSVVAVESDVLQNGKSVCGYGFNSNGRYSQGGILRERIFPRLLNAKEDELLEDVGKNFDASKCWQVMMKNEKPGGHGERSVAVGTVDMAIWDLIAKIEKKPLYKLLAQKYAKGKITNNVYVYAAGGYYYPGKSITDLQEEFKSYLDMGFTTCKMKIGRTDLDEDIKRIEAALEVVGKGENLAVDANGRFDLNKAIQYCRIIDSYQLKWYEEPGDPLDYLLNKAVSDLSKTPIATGENLFSLPDARNLIRYGGMNPKRDYLQFDPALSYGLVEYIRILQMLEEHGWSADRCIPHGGHQFGLHIAAGLGLYGNEAYPGVFLPFGKFAAGTILDKGYVTLLDAPGIGMELIPEVYTIFEKLIKK
jgi:L-alanine-DL-glutamate epimerase-like enolase superfamily enzyme